MPFTLQASAAPRALRVCPFVGCTWLLLPLPLCPLMIPCAHRFACASKLHAVAARSLPASVRTRSRAAGRRDNTRLPRKAFAAVPAPTYAAFSPMAPAPPQTAKQCTRARRGPLSGLLQRLSRESTALQISLQVPRLLSHRFVLTVQGAPWHRSRYPKTHCNMRIQGTPNY